GFSAPPRTRCSTHAFRRAAFREKQRALARAWRNGCAARGKPRNRSGGRSKQIFLYSRCGERIPQVLVCRAAGDQAARRTLQEADLDEVGLVEVFDGAAVFADG